MNDLVKKTITINKDLINDLQILAKNSERSLSGYIRAVLKEHVESETVVTINPVTANIITTENTTDGQIENKETNNSNTSTISNQNKFRV